MKDRAGSRDGKKAGLHVVTVEGIPRGIGAKERFLVKKHRDRTGGEKWEGKGG